ncbi:MAG TPA: DUF4838 domain-containing protein [Planctomycetaceae bacterium]|nr:DUF4838 domain-containing protein [Planctomycetaceae bacterium]
MALCSRTLIVLLLLSMGGAAKAETRFTAVHLVSGPKADAIESRSVTLLRDRIAEITTAPVTVGPFPQRFAGLVVCIGTISSHPDLATRAKELGIAQPSGLDPGAEGFVLKSKKVRGQQVVLAIGSDRRGVLYAVGEILRRMVGRGGTVSFPGELSIRRAPRWPVRGLIVSQGATMRQLTGARAWTTLELQRAHLDYALSGANTFELDENEGPDGMYAFLKSYGLDTLAVIEGNNGSGPPEWQAKEAIGRGGYLCPGIPEARAALLRQHEELFKRMPAFDYVHFKSGDGGGDESEASAPYGRTLIHLCEEYARILHKYHPHTKIFVGNQKLDNAGDQAIFAYLQAKPRDWIDGIVYGPGSNAMGWTPGRRQDHRMDLFQGAGRGALSGYLREMLHQLPPRQSILLFTDLTHWVYSQYGLMDHALIPDRNHQMPPKWDYWMYDRKPSAALAQVFNRRTFHARPRNYYRVFQETTEFAIGDVAYSEGHHDHLNEWIYQRLFWDPHQTVESVVAEYSRVHFGPEAAPQMAEALFTLEHNLETPIRGNAGIGRMVELVESAGTVMPADVRERNYLWREYLQKAYLDRYIQHDVDRQNDSVDAMLAQLRSAFDRDDVNGAVLNLADAELPAPSTDMLRLKSEADRVGRESDRLFGVRNEGLFNLKQDYVGFGWLKRELRRAAAAPSTEKRRAIVERIVYYDDPGAGGFYDNAGDPQKSPHLVYGWPYAGGLVSHDNRPSQRKMAFTTDEERGVTFQYDNLDRSAQYRVRLSLIRPRYARRYAVRQHQKTESIYADDHPLAENLELPEYLADFVEFDIPQAATSDGRLTLWMKKQPGIGTGLKSDLTVWRNTGGWGTLVSEVWLMKKGASPRRRAGSRPATRTAD